MPKPRGSTGATKMKIMAVICHNGECGDQAYGYNIWQTLKDNFYMYMNESDVRNVYHHLKDLCQLNLVERMECEDPATNIKCWYSLTEKGIGLMNNYLPYLEVLRRKTGFPRG
jgi:hypothetical protein